MGLIIAVMETDRDCIIVIMAEIWRGAIRHRNATTEHHCFAFSVLSKIEYGAANVPVW